MAGRWGQTSGPSAMLGGCSGHDSSTPAAWQRASEVWLLCGFFCAHNAPWLGGSVCGLAMWCMWHPAQVTSVTREVTESAVSL